MVWSTELISYVGALNWKEGQKIRPLEINQVAGRMQIDLGKKYLRIEIEWPQWGRLFSV